MNILQRSAEFVHALTELRDRTAAAWRKCPHCGSENTILYGFYYRHPWALFRRLDVRVQRHRCKRCGKTYAETSPDLVFKSWYTRSVHRLCVDCACHFGISLRKVAQLVGSLIGQQDGWWRWHPAKEGDPQEKRCYLAHTTVHYWLKKAGKAARKSIKDHLKGISCSGEMGTDGLWARLCGGIKRVALMLIDYQSGLIFPPVIVEGEEAACCWGQMFERAEEAGLQLDQLNGITSDGSQGLLSYLRDKLSGVHQQRCIWHLWRSVGRIMARQIAEAVKGLTDEAAKEKRRELRQELGGLLHNFFDAISYENAEQALTELAAHTCGQALVEWLRPLQDAALMYLMPCHQGLNRVSPEWYWRDFRQRISHGRNHRSEQQLEQALLIWAIHHNFTPAQRRSERKRKYRHPGQSPLEVAGASPGRLSYLDALEV